MSAKLIKISDTYKYNFNGIGMESTRRHGGRQGVEVRYETGWGQKGYPL